MTQNQQLQENIDNYINDNLTHENLSASFRELIILLVDYKKVSLSENQILDIIESCYDKLEKFDKNKSKAFNYFLTIILCYFKQLKRKNYE